MSKLKGAANSVAQSFNSLMNYSTDYVMEIISGIMARKRIEEAEIDLMTGEIRPRAIRAPGVVGVVGQYRRMLDGQLKLSNRSLGDVESAKITIRKTGEREGGWAPYEVRCAIALKNGQRTVGSAVAGWMESGGKGAVAWREALAAAVLLVLFLLFLNGLHY